MSKKEKTRTRYSKRLRQQRRKPVSLSVHKNTKEQKARKNIRESLRRAVSSLFQTFPDISGYVILTWDKDFSYGCHTDCIQGEKQIPTALLPEFVKMSLVRALITRQDFEDHMADFTFE